MRILISFGIQNMNQFKNFKTAAISSILNIEIGSHQIRYQVHTRVMFDGVIL